MQNPIKTAVQSRVSGALGGAFFGLGVLGPIGQGMMAVSIIIGAALFAVHEYQVIVISNQEMEASRFDAQSVLAANHLTPQQAAANLAAGVVINGLDGLPIIGKSLETLVTYLQGQAKITAALGDATRANIMMSPQAPASTPDEHIRLHPELYITDDGVSFTGQEKLDFARRYWGIIGVRTMGGKQLNINHAQSFEWQYMGKPKGQHGLSGSDDVFRVMWKDKTGKDDATPYMNN